MPEHLSIIEKERERNKQGVSTPEGGGERERRRCQLRCVPNAYDTADVGRNPPRV
jgi:hypothetical protein